MILALLLGCEDTLAIPLHFDGPSGAAWLDTSEDLPFEDAVGFVSNSRSGKIVPLDLKEGRLLTDDATGSFLRASSLATGRQRQLRDVAAFAADGAITLWSIDERGAVLVQVPYTTGVDEDGVPVEAEITATEPVFLDPDGSGDTPTLDGLRVRAGYTTTEDWSVEFDGSRWWAVGAHSGRQVTEPVPGKTYTTDFGELEFVVEGDATEGDRFEFRTESGLSEWSLDGRPTALADDGARLFVAVDSATPLVGVMEPWTGAWLGHVALPVDAHPWRMAFSPGGELFVADARSPAVYRITFATAGDPTTATVETIVASAPVIDVVVQTGLLGDGSTFERLFVAPVGLQRVDVYDLVARAWVDVNPIDAEVAGVDIGSPIAGLAPSAGLVATQQPTSWGAYPEVPVITVATQDGFVYLLDATTGCAVPTLRGPHGPNEVLDSSDSFQYALLDDQGPASDVILAYDEATGEQVAVSPCPGVALTEYWTVTYDSAAASWEVEGSQSGVQVNRAYEDQRYVSDNGAVSFLLLSGTLPATDGDSFGFTVDRGLLGWSFADINEDGTLTAGLESYWEAPGRPLSFEYQAGPTGGGWDPVNRKQMSLILAENSDEVGRVHLDGGKADVTWE